MDGCLLPSYDNKDGNDDNSVDVKYVSWSVGRQLIDWRAVDDEDTTKGLACPRRSSQRGQKVPRSRSDFPALLNFRHFYLPFRGTVDFVRSIFF